MVSKNEIIWSDEAISNLEDILDYLERKWTEREVIQFKKLLSKQVEVIRNFPTLFPASEIRPQLRKSVLSKQTSILYLVRKKQIFLIYLFDNRMNPKRLE